jgi:hypothetical protein
MTIIFDDTTERLIDYSDAPNIFVDRLGGIEEFGPVTHLLFGTRRKIEGRTSCLVSVRLIVPTALLSDILLQLSRWKTGAKLTADMPTEWQTVN